MKTTEEIHQLYEMNNEAERNISLDKWFSEEEIIKALKTQRNKGMGNFNYFEFMDDLGLLGGDDEE